jgi:hypothetical protein
VDHLLQSKRILPGSVTNFLSVYQNLLKVRDSHFGMLLRTLLRHPRLLDTIPAERLSYETTTEIVLSLVALPPGRLGAPGWSPVLQMWPSIAMPLLGVLLNVALGYDVTHVNHLLAFFVLRGHAPASREQDQTALTRLILDCLAHTYVHLGLSEGEAEGLALMVVRQIVHLPFDPRLQREGVVHCFPSLCVRQHLYGNLMQYFAALDGCPVSGKARDPSTMGREDEPANRNGCLPDASGSLLVESLRQEFERVFCSPSSRHNPAQYGLFKETLLPAQTHRVPAPRPDPLD